MSESVSVRRFVLEPRREGMWWGLSLSGWVTLGVGFAVALGFANAGSLLVGVAVFLVALPVAKARVAGGTLPEWLGVVTRWLLWRVLGADRYVAPVRFVGEAGRAVPALTGVSLVGVPGVEGAGMVVDRSGHAVSAVFRVEGRAFQLLLAEDQARLLADWGHVLAGQCHEGSAVVRVSWSMRSGPTAMGAHQAWTAQVRPVGCGAVAAGSYDRLTEVVGAVSSAHEVHVTVTVDARRVPYRPKPSGPSREQVTGDVLMAAVGQVARELGSMGLSVGPVLGVGGLSELLVAGADPVRARERDTVRALGAPLGDADPGSAWPVAVSGYRGHAVVDGVFHVVFAVDGWPSTPLPPGWFESFGATGLSVGERRVTVIHQMTSPTAARGATRRELASVEGNVEVKRQKRILVTSQDRNRLAAARQREDELAAGHQLVRYVGLVSVSAASLDELDAAVAEVTTQARQSGIELRRLWLVQDRAWAAVLPFGLGLTRVGGR